ncbi:Uncharacterised protein [Mycolicibacterium aurum]|uniref:Transmembrane protein n=1 Tax=Mycolicibacterium aurum TaxID=1791 RepID=A0A448IHJ7_MYCAU|nr:hypothetical protein [Mycolicibacterium aurum]VEG51774.1 Uncharacterised protein [Mycolicibacterium aurum]
MTPTIDWVRATVVGAIAGGALWALAVYALIATEGAIVAWATVCIIQAAVLGAGIVAFRRATADSIRCYAVGAILTPLVGLIPAAVFGVAGLIVKVVG